MSVDGKPEAILDAGLQSAGLVLRKKRGERDMSIEEVARHTGLTPGAVNTLEADDYARLPAAVYVRGYIRRYCALLDIDETPLIAAYETVRVELDKTRDKAQRAKVSQSQAMRNHYQPDRRRAHLLMLIAVAAVLVTAVTVMGKWLYKEYSAALANGQLVHTVAPVLSAVTAAPDQKSVTAPHSSASVLAGNETVPVHAATVGKAPPDSAEDEITGAVAEQPGEGTSHGREQPGSDIDGENKTAAAVSETAPPGALELNFVEESWVKVVDGSGAILVMTQEPAGARLLLNGQPPFSLILGNAPGVTVNYRGESVPVTDINSQTRAARFVVGQ